MDALALDTPVVDSPIIDPASGTRFSTALDPATMAAVFGRHLPRAAGQIVACAVTRYRHRPGERCLVQYALTVRDAAGVETSVRVTGQWHAEHGRAAHLSRTLARAARVGAAAWTAPLAPVFYDDGTGMLGTTFPWDRRLQALPEVASGRSPRLVAPMLAWLGVHPRALLATRVETVRYREQLNAVCRYTLEIRAAPAARFYVKAYADDGGATAAALLACLAHATAGAGMARVQRAVAYDHDRRALVLADTPGAPLDQVMLGPEPATGAALTRVAVALARFGAATAPLVRVRGPAARLEAADRSAAALVEALAPDAAAAVHAARRTARTLLRPGPARLTHGDLKLEHIFVADRDVFLIDVDSCHLGDPLWDLALLEARWLAARDTAPGGWRRGRQECRHLSDTYLSHAGPTDLTALGALRALALLDVAAGLVKRREPDWQRRAGRLVADADRALEARR